MNNLAPSVKISEEEKQMLQQEFCELRKWLANMEDQILQNGRPLTDCPCKV